MNKAKKSPTNNEWCNCGESAASSVDYSEGRGKEDIPCCNKKTKNKLPK